MSAVTRSWGEILNKTIENYFSLITVRMNSIMKEFIIHCVHKIIFGSLQCQTRPFTLFIVFDFLFHLLYGAQMSVILFLPLIEYMKKNQY